MRPAGLSAFLILGALSGALFGFSGPARALSADAAAAQCEQAAARAAQATGAPLDILRAVSLVESRRAVDGEARPWPWTVNTEGRSYWFDTRREAERFVRNEVARGNRSMDIGCFQVNTRWHGEAFESAVAMFDPLGNALYAAQFLSALRAETGAWESAIGLYHSRTPELRDAYAGRVGRMMARLEPLPDDAPRTVVAALDAPPADPASANPVPLAPASRPTLVPGAGAVAIRVASLFANGEARPLISTEGRGSLFAPHQPLIVR